MNPMEIERLLRRFCRNAPAVPGALREVETVLGFPLPDAYVDFLRQTNGGQGLIGNAYVILWPCEELVEMQKAYEASVYAPGLVLFGSDGGGEAFAFDARLETRPIISLPFLGMDPKVARSVASDFEAFMKELGRLQDPAMQPELNSDNRLLDCAGKEIFEIHPVILGGSPTDPANKVVLTREQHIEAVRYWNKVIRDVRNSQNVAR